MIKSLIGQNRTRRRISTISLAVLGISALAIILATQALGRPATQGPPTTFTSKSNGTDGALVMLDPGTYIFNPREFDPQLDPDGDNVFHFTEVNIGQDVTVILSGEHFDGPVYWLSQGPILINGTLNLDGEEGRHSPIALGDRRPSIPGAGGFPGGVVGFALSPPQHGSGPGGGRTDMTACCSGRGHAGHANAAGGQFDGPSYGNIFLVPLLGGSGGGGSWNSPVENPSGGGAGGGAIMLASIDSIILNGVITANGGDRPLNSNGSCCRAGGAGSGGAIHLISTIISGSGEIEARGGRPANSSSGSEGGIGRVRLDAFEQAFEGSINASLTRGSPFVVLPSDVPILRVTKIGESVIAGFPTGNFENPDFDIDEGETVTVEIEAGFVPPGTTVQVHVFSENDVDQIADSTPLDGTVELSTATADIVFPTGFSRIMLQADWD